MSRLSEIFERLSLRDLGRALRQQIERIPGFGLVSLTPVKEHFLAIRDALLTAIGGSIGLWLPSAVIVLEHDSHVGVGPLLSRVADAALKGDVLILVPSLLAPLFLMILALNANQLIRGHQITLFVVSLLIAAWTLLVYVTKVASNVPDTQFLVQASEWGAALSLIILYLYFLLKHLPENILASLQGGGASLADEIVALRRGPMA